MSFARQLLYSIADQMGRSRRDMDPYVGALEKNWFDTKDAMKSMKEKDFDRLDFPIRLTEKIMQKLGSRGKSQISQKMQVETPLADYINTLKNNIKKQDFNQVITLLIKIFANIRDNVTEEKYRTLKKSNQKIGKLTSLSEVEKILIYGGFQKQSQCYKINKINLSLIDQCIAELDKYVERVKFNPYAQQIISVGSSNIKNYEGESSVVFNEKLAELEQQRQRMMSKPIKDRDVKVFQVKPQFREKMEVEFNEKQELNEDEKIYMQSVKQKLKHFGQDPQFMNRRKKQYFDLLKKPCFTETLVRVKMPDNYVFQCKFSPMETLQTLVDIFHEHLQNKKIDYYLYMTPPVQKLRGVILRKTFYDLGCVPRAVFYFKTEQEIKGNILKEKKGGLFGFFS